MRIHHGGTETRRILLVFLLIAAGCSTQAPVQPATSDDCPACRAIGASAFDEGMTLYVGVVPPSEFSILNYLKHYFESKRFYVSVRPAEPSGLSCIQLGVHRTKDESPVALIADLATGRYDGAAGLNALRILKSADAPLHLVVRPSEAKQVEDDLRSLGADRISIWAFNPHVPPPGSDVSDFYGLRVCDPVLDSFRQPRQRDR